MTARAPDSGVVLITILIVIALCASVVVAKTAASERTAGATFRDLEFNQARGLVTAGRASAVSALLRDLENPPQADGMTEDWARLAQYAMAIADGRFQFEMHDEAGRFNLNTLTAVSAWSSHVLDALITAAGPKPEVAVRVSAALIGGTPLLQTPDLIARAGLSAAEVAALVPFATRTPNLGAGVNVNTAPEALLSAFKQEDAVIGRILHERKARRITTETLEEMDIQLPEGLTLRSDVFGLTTAVSYSGADVVATSMIHRWRDLRGQAHAVIFARKLGHL